MSANPPEAPSTFSLVRGGPLQTLRRALRLTSELRAGAALVVATWVPLVVLALVEWLRSGRTSPIIADVGVHARLVVGIPLLFLAEHSVHIRSVRCIDRFIEDRWAVDPAPVTDAVARAKRWRDALAPEALLLALAALGSEVVLWGASRPIWNVGGRAVDVPWTAVKVWYGLISLPIFQFLVYRWLWRWIIWTRLLWQLSRLKLDLVPTHPDRQGGLGYLSETSVGFAYVVMASSAVQAGGWANRVLTEHVNVLMFKQPLLLLLVLSVAIPLVPLLPFSRHLWLLGFSARRAYDDLAIDYCRRFHRRWVEGHRHEKLLGSPDIQSLADLGNAYQTLLTLRVMAFNPRITFILAAATLVPMLPLVLLQVPLGDLLKKLGGIALGKLPG